MLTELGDVCSGKFKILLEVGTFIFQKITNCYDKYSLKTKYNSGKLAKNVYLSC